MPLALVWCDFWYSPEGSVIAEYGEEEVSYELADSKPQWIKAALEIWSAQWDTAYAMPATLSLTAEEDTEFANPVLTSLLR